MGLKEKGFVSGGHSHRKAGKMSGVPVEPRHCIRTLEEKLVCEETELLLFSLAYGISNCWVL